MLSFLPYKKLVYDLSQFGEGGSKRGSSVLVEWLFFVFFTGQVRGACCVTFSVLCYLLLLGATEVKEGLQTWTKITVYQPFRDWPPPR